MKIRFLYAVVLICLVLPAHAERYSVWVDESGAVHHAPVPEAENPILKRARELERQRLQGAGSVSAEAAGESSSRSASGGAAAGQDVDLSPATEASAAENLESARPQESVLVSGAASPEITPAPGSVPVPLRQEEYVDAAELAARGFVRDDDQRFYVWVDERGVVHNVPLPQSDNGAKKLPAILAEQAKPSPFLIEERIRPAIAQTLPVDSYAQTLLGLEQPSGMLGSLSETCCAELPRGDLGKLKWDEDFLIELDASYDRFDFATGTSTYQLLRLPKARSDYLMRVRALIVKGGIFQPTLVFLNKDMRPVRLVRNLLHEFKPENWIRYGYLEGWIQVEATQGEAFVLVLTVEEDLDQSTLIRHKDKDRQIPHRPDGLLHLMVVAP